jgi:3alpha(or 20beta)-hydroxysteroid dehydrogenase
MNLTEKQLNKRVALITGAARGIGLASLELLARAGAHVIAFDLPSADYSQARQIAAEHDVDLLVVTGDVSVSADWRRAVDEAIARFGQINVLVNNAGVSGAIGPLVHYDDDEFDRVMQVNARGVFLGMKYVCKTMRNTGGSVVNVSSVSGIGGGRFTVAYTASKHAVVGMTKLAATELAPHNIRVNVVCPAPTATEMMFSMERSQSPEDPELVRARMSQMIPMGRYGEPHEIAAIILFLASDASSFITGAAIPVDGGLKAS